MKRSLLVILLLSAASCAPEQIVAATAAAGSAAAGMTGASGAGGSGGGSGSGGSGGGSGSGSSGDGGTGGGTSPPACADNGDCALGELCEKQDCAATTGSCVAQPPFCDAAPGPVCGCNGITYFNDCLRRANLIAAGMPGGCQAEAVHCGGFGQQQCPDESYCARLMPLGPMGSQCPPDVPGSCWVLPAACDAVPAGGDRWIACAGGADCLDICAAIRTEQPYARAGRCPP